MVLLPALVSAQGKLPAISGTISNNNREPLHGATITLLNENDSLLTQKQTSISNGSFLFTAIVPGKYHLRVTFTGHQQFSSPPFLVVDKDVEIPPVILQTTSNTLQEVVVKSKKPLIELSLDRTIVNVEAMISSASSNTLEVLEKTPGVTVNSSGEISLNGRSGVLMLINGRQTYLSGPDLAAYLKTIPGAQLDKIELIDNPPAKYDAAGSAVINLRLKKSRAGGLTGSLNLGYSQGKYARWNNGLNLNYNHKKINLYGNFGFNKETNFTDDKSNRWFYNDAGNSTSSLIVQNLQLNSGRSANALIGIDYYPAAQTSFGFQLNGSRRPGRGSLSYSNDSYFADGSADTSFQGMNASRESRKDLGLAANLQHQFKNPGQELSADLSFNRYNSAGDQQLQNNNFLYLLGNAINIYSTKIDYIHPFGKEARWEAGLKSSSVQNSNNNDYYTITNDHPLIEDGRSNHFSYRENIYAAYGTVQKKWKRFGLQTGLRVENTSSNGRQAGNSITPASSFSKNYTELFPSIFISYKLDSLGKRSIGFMLTRRINRPNYQYLNPFIFYKDQYSYTTGNPELTPQFQYRYELKYQHNKSLQFSFSYNRFTDVIFQTTKIINKVFITGPENISKGFMVHLFMNHNLTVTKWWTVNTNAWFTYLGLRGITDGEALQPTTFVFRTNIISQFQFGKNWSGDINAFFASRNLNAQMFTGPMVRANWSLQKKFNDGKASLRLGMEDIFHSWVTHNTSFGLKNTKSTQIYFTDTQRVQLALTWRFGKDNLSRKRKGSQAADEEKGRVD